MRQPTPLERRIDNVAHRLLAGAPAVGVRAVLLEVGVFVLKQAWACIFGAALLVVIVGRGSGTPTMRPSRRTTRSRSRPCSSRS